MESVNSPLLFGSLATTLPSSNTCIGVPYMRTALRVVRALFLRTTARPCGDNCSDSSAHVFDFYIENCR
jgi:hypothetical protein